LHEDEQTEVATKVQLDAVINHQLGVQVLHSHFVEQDIPAKAANEAQRLGSTLQ
jgi:asparagine synthase (glutamine-hydrolysing)